MYAFWHSKSKLQNILKKIALIINIDSYQAIMFHFSFDFTTDICSWKINKAMFIMREKKNKEIEKELSI